MGGTDDARGAGGNYQAGEGTDTIGPPLGAYEEHPLQVGVHCLETGRLSPCDWAAIP